MYGDAVYFEETRKMWLHPSREMGMERKRLFIIDRVMIINHG